MPVIYVRPQYNSQDGYANGSGELYTVPSYNYSLANGRSGFVRFSHVEVPKGATINSAKLHIAMSVKTPTNAYSAVLSPYIDLRHDSPWLDTTRAEWAGRSWHKPAGQPNSTFTWSNPQVTPLRQIQTMDVKTIVQDVLALANWSPAGGPMTFRIEWSSVSSPDYTYVHTVGDNSPPILEIDYTPPVSDGRETVVNIQENANFTRTQNSNAAFSIEPFAFNPYFGTYVQPTYSINAAGSPTAPFGGNVLRVVAGNGRAMVHDGLPLLEEGRWWNYSAYVWVPTGSPDVSLTILGTRSASETMSSKGQWVRISQSVISNGNSQNWFTIHQNTALSGSVFYVANVQLTEGKVLRPFISGNRTLTNATYGWAGGTGQNGYVRAVAPTVVANPITDKARRKYWSPSWTYSNSAGHAQVYAEIKTRRVK